MLVGSKGLWEYGCSIDSDRLTKNRGVGQSLVNYTPAIEVCKEHYVGADCSSTSKRVMSVAHGVAMEFRDVAVFKGRGLVGSERSLGHCLWKGMRHCMSEFSRKKEADPESI